MNEHTEVIQQEQYTYRQTMLSFRRKWPRIAQNSQRSVAGPRNARCMATLSRGCVSSHFDFVNPAHKLIFTQTDTHIRLHHNLNNKVDQNAFIAETRYFNWEVNIFFQSFISHAMIFLVFFSVTVNLNSSLYCTQFRLIDWLAALSCLIGCTF